jgi:hypothetical protein
VKTRFRPVVAASLAGVLSLSISACRVGAPIHVWKPPAIASAVGSRVVVAELAGPRETAAAVRSEMFHCVPQDEGRELAVVDPMSLPAADNIRLVSASDNEPSDLAVSMAAKDHKIDYILRGEVLDDRSWKKSEIDTPIRMSWRLIDVQANQSLGGGVVVVDQKSATERYPDLAFLGDPKTVLTTAAARQTFDLITPSIDRVRVQLAVPYMTLGARKTRRGNLAAMRGRWADAEKIWSEVANDNPSQAAAKHNLAIAAAAGQDFDRAKQLIREVHSRWSGELIEETLAWIELRQRDYHQAFGLPDPPEGWCLTQPSDLQPRR